MTARAFLLILAGLAAGPALAASVQPVRPIRAMTLVSAADLELSETEVPGAIGAIEDAVGLEARVTLYPGRPVLASQLGPPALVERNQVVRMVFNRGALAIAADGRALDRGGLGERIRVMNLASKQIVTGAIQDDGSIEVGQ